MSVNSSKLVSAGLPVRHRRYGKAAMWTLWVLASFILSQLILTALIYALSWMGVDFVMIESTTFNFIVAALSYAISLVIAISGPWIIKKHRITMADLGLSRLPSWMDIALAPAGFVVYLLASATLVYVVTQLVPGFNADQTQEVGFENISQRYEYILAFVTLVVIAPIAEETLFRGFLYGKLRKTVPLWLAIVVTSAIFGAVHGQWNVGVDVFVLSVVMCSLREVTGSIWAGILLHMIKNGLAFYLLFINPSILHTIGG